MTGSEQNIGKQNSLTCNYKEEGEWTEHRLIIRGKGMGQERLETTMAWRAEPARHS